MSGVAVLEPAFSPAELDNLHDVRLKHPGYYPVGAVWPQAHRPKPRPVSEQLRFAPGLAGRADVVRHVQLTGDNPSIEIAPSRRLAYLRAMYADEGASLLTPVDTMLASPGLSAAAADHFGCGVVDPRVVFANVYLPGQGLGLHTDVPAFRGAERGQLPPWLLVVMHHAGLFERWHLRVATAVCYLHPGAGGALRYYLSPDDAVGSPVRVIPRPNTGVLFDADTIFHEVEQVGGELDAFDHVPDGLHLVETAADQWELRASGKSGVQTLATLGSDQLRFSVSWKAYCFENEAARQSWVDHDDDLPLDRIIPRLIEALRVQDALPGDADRLGEEDLAIRMIDHFVSFPQRAKDGQ